MISSDSEVKNFSSTSYASGTSQLPLLGVTIGQNLRRTASTWPAADALVDLAQGMRYNYEEFDAAVDNLARALLGAGMAKGDRVAVWAPNCSEWVLLQYATARVGVILVNINPAYRTYELQYALNQSGSRMLFAGRRGRWSS